MAIHEVEVDFTLSADDDTHAVVIDDKRRSLLPNQLKQLFSTVNEGQLVAEVNILAELHEMRREDVAHA